MIIQITLFINSKQFLNEGITNNSVNIDIEIQKHVLNKFGFNSTEEDLKEYWKIPKIYWFDQEVKNSIFYMRYNIFEYSQIKIGESMPNCRLINQSYPHNIVELSKLQTQKPLVILAGSIT
jgi:hypothetical protein